MPTIIESGIPLPEEFHLPEILRLFSSLITRYRNMPTVALQSVTIYDNSLGETIDEDDSRWDDVYTCTHDRLLRTADRLAFEGSTYYRPNLALMGVQNCGNCAKLLRSTDTLGCFCKGCIISRLPPKSSPVNGWIVSRVDQYDVSSTFGFELELEAIASQPSHQGPRAIAENIIRAVEGHPPIVSTTDGSLTNGCEMVSHPMTLDYIVKNNETLKRMFVNLREQFRAEDGEGNHTAGLHIHVGKSIFPANPSRELLNLINVEWVTAHLEFLILLSGRPAYNFKKWCMNEYKYIAPRNQCNTWECRGFSNHALFDSGADDGNCNGPWDSAEDLPHLCDWIKAIAWMSHDEPRFGLSPLEIMKQSGASEESIHWITGFSGHSIGAPALAHSAEKSRWKELCGKYATRMAGCLVRLRDGGIYYGEESNQYCPNGNPDVSRCGIATICSNGIIGVNQRWNVKDRHSVCFYADAQHLEIVEGIPYPGDIPSQVFTPTNVIAHSDLHSISLVTHSRTQVT